MGCPNWRVCLKSVLVLIEDCWWFYWLWIVVIVVRFKDVGDCVGWFVIVFMISFWSAIFWVRWWSFCSQCTNQPPIGKSWKTQHIVGFKYPHHYILWYYQGQTKYVFDLTFLCCDVNIMPYQATQHTATQEGSKVREDIPGNYTLKIQYSPTFILSPQRATFLESL